MKLFLNRTNKKLNCDFASYREKKWRMRGGEKMKRINENALVFNGIIKQNSVRYTIAFVKENRGGVGE